jgi:acetylornithine deacetylase/succinyl-diaminopimelate desuccinylase-like protein
VRLTAPGSPRHDALEHVGQVGLRIELMKFLRKICGRSVREVALPRVAGSSAVVCGLGDILQTHKADEFKELSELTAGGEMLTRSARELS